MGCDIHGFCEVYENGKWTMVGGFEDVYDPKDIGDEPYTGRNYNLFSLLSGVRNHNNIKPIAELRGVPKDCSDNYRRIVEQYGIDGHSHSYLMLDELLMVDLEKLVNVNGVLSEETYHKAKLGKIPTSYSRGVSGPKHFSITNGQMDEVLTDRKKFVEKHGLELLEKQKDAFKYSPDCPAAKTAEKSIAEFKSGAIDPDSFIFNTMFEWKEPLGDLVGVFFTKCVPAMLAQSSSGDSIHVRYVFFFDN